MSAGGSELVSFVIQGKTTDVSVNPNASVGEDIGRALEQSGIDSGDASLWNARTSDGTMLDNNQSLSEQGVGRSAKLFLDKGPGRGG